MRRGGTGQIRCWARKSWLCCALCSVCSGCSGVALCIHLFTAAPSPPIRREEDNVEDALSHRTGQAETFTARMGEGWGSEANLHKRARKGIAGPAGPAVGKSSSAGVHHASYSSADCKDDNFSLSRSCGRRLDEGPNHASPTICFCPSTSPRPPLVPFPATLSMPHRRAR